jgi:hypothetical protein
MSEYKQADEAGKRTSVAGHNERLVINLLGNDEKVDELLTAIDKAARDESTYEYGLPLWSDGSKEILRKIVIKWIAGL